ncbi:hypothetical protein HDV06_001201 [Boothiomyces sp. JEL0866]|nr:hypothetical protein HDV06_001201 [Boothiomyces sp. JEL0866]
MGKSLLVTLGLAQEQIIQTYVPDGSRTVEINKKGDFLNNQISTGKYSIVSFVPKFTLEFFSKYANMFFLFISCIQPVRDWSPTSKIATAGPLAAIFIITAFKEMWEDKKRHAQDSAVNNSECKVLQGDKFIKTLWKDVKVGEIVRIENGRNFPSDIVIISTSEPDSLCYIETSNLDGETNLKIRQGIPETGHLQSPEAVAKLQGVVGLTIGTIETELPNNSLYTFKATLRFAGQELAIGPNQLLLRGAQLRNTKWIYGLVVFTGHETKLMKNSTATPIKSTKVDSMVNSQVILLFVFLVLLAVGCAVGELYLEKSTNFVQDILSPVGGYSPTTPFQFFEHVMTFMILFNNLIPLSLMISLEFVKLVLGMYINQDLDMYYDEKEMPATAKTTTLVEELGQVDFIFSDKTGTLTRNIMEFKKFTVGGNAYTLTEWPTQTEKGYYNKKHFESHKTQPQFAVLKDFLSLLSVCHTVIPEVDENSEKIIYQASSPDEVALVDGARTLGYTRRPKSVTMSADGVDQEYQILHVNEFNSTRKRMSLVVRAPDGKVKLMIKGAETVILERLGPGCTFKDATMQHMEEYANEGLRTLVYAYRDVEESEYNEWHMVYEKAATSITNREEMLDQAAELIEKNLNLVGATAIEDKLQDGVPDTIYNLLEAGIRMWVLTGDRQDTAINIGISCKLLNPQMEMIVCNKETKEETKAFLEEALADAKKILTRKYTRPSKWKQFWRGIHVKNAKFDKDYGVGFEPMALVIDGNTLTHALDPEVSDIFLEVALLCKSVICCRVSPLQKALVVKLVKSNVAGAVTLAIGDGANDVSMIQSANVGVGISGQEGLQAARSADFAIGQFRYLRKLLLVHGGWAYSRISKTLFETWSGVSSYNVAWTLLPPIAIGVFDQYISAQVLFKYPRMYRNGQDDRFYNHYTFILWILNAIFHSLLLFYGWVYILGDGDILANGLVSDNWVFGIFVYVTTLTTVMIKHCLIIDLFNGWSLFSIFGSLIAYYILLPIYCLNSVGPKYVSKELFNVNPAIFGSVTFFLSLVFLPFAINLRDFAWKFYKRFFTPQSYHIIQEIQKHNIPDYSVKAQWFHTTVSKIQKMREMNLDYGYAFSQNDQQQEKKVVDLYDTTKRKPHG